MFPKNYHLNWTVGRANILCKYSIYIYIYIYIFSFGHGFSGCYSVVFPEAVISYDKKSFKQFLLHFTSVCMISKIVPQIFKIVFQTGNVEMLIFLSFVLSFLIDMSN